MKRLRTPRGQAAVETALTVPLAVFMLLGTLQLFMLLHARILAQYAVGRAARSGSVNFGSCTVMEKTAIAVLVPALDRSFARPTGANARANRYWDRFRATQDNSFEWPPRSNGASPRTPVVWIDRQKPDYDRDAEELWSWPTNGNGPDYRHLEIRMVFFAPMHVPFANWAFSRIALAHWGVLDAPSVRPYMPATAEGSWRHGDVGATSSPQPTQVTDVMRASALAEAYVFPIQANAVVQMMSPPRWPPRACWVN